MDVRGLVEAFLAGKGSQAHVRVVAFTDEEGMRFHTTFLGSRALIGAPLCSPPWMQSCIPSVVHAVPERAPHRFWMPTGEGATATGTAVLIATQPFHLEVTAMTDCGAGHLTPEILSTADADGVSVADAIGLPEEPAAREAALGTLAMPPGQIRAYVEAHMEQGPVLEAAGQPVGIVRAISGQSRLQVQVVGEQGHAGAPQYPCHPLLPRATLKLAQRPAACRHMYMKEPESGVVVGACGGPVSGPASALRGASCVPCTVHPKASPSPVSSQNRW